jgi:hypothetical protein
MAADATCCCPQGYPGHWNEKELQWRDMPFVKARVRSFLHIPLNFSGVLARNVALIEAAGALPEEFIVLADENSLWGADIYIAVTRPVPGAAMAKLSGSFLTKVFEGPFKEIRNWIGQMRQYVATKGKQCKQLYFYYRTCPRCAKKFGKNFVVLLARV